MTALGLLAREGGEGSEKGEVKRKEYVCVLQMPLVTKGFIVPSQRQDSSSPHTSLPATNASHQPQQLLTLPMGMLPAISAILTLGILT